MTMSPNISRRGLQNLPQTELAKVLGGLFADPGERAPVVRGRGSERKPITPMVRALVYKRDGYTCQRCGRAPWSRDGFESGPLHLDHVVPWSAGGSDTTDNLRTLCEKCNLDRSNFVNDDDKPVTPIVRVCAPCLAAFEPQHERWIAAVPESNRFPAYCAKGRHVGWAIPGWRIL